MRTILLDVGGTFVKGSDLRQTPIASGGSREQIAAALAQAIGPLDDVSGIGVAIPGPFDYRQGIFLMKHKFAAVYGESFRSLAAIPDRIELMFCHDVNAQLLGAVRMLRLEKENTALVTLGTGLGFSYALQGEVRSNAAGSPLRSLWDLPLDGGGILEDRISARGIRAAYAARTDDSSLSVLDIARRAYAGEEAAAQVFAQLGDGLGAALEDIIRQLDIHVLLMGGQISKSLSLMQRQLQDRLPGIHIAPVPEGAVFEGLASLFDKPITK